MSNEAKKPAVTKAGHTETKTPEVRKGFFVRRKKSKTSSQIINNKATISEGLVGTKNRTPAKQKHSKQLNKSKRTTRTNKTRQQRTGSSLKLNRRTVFVGIAAVLALVIVGYSIVSNDKQQSAGSASSAKTEAQLLDARDGSSGGAPFATVSPGTTEGKLRTQFDAEKGFYSFQEEVNGKIITVSQTVVPSDFILDVQSLLETTKYSSASSLETNKGTTYILMLDGSLLQQVFFKYNNFLVSVYAVEGLPNNAWIEYINSL